MKISELQANTGNVDIEGVVKGKGEPRTFNKFGKEGKVCKCTIADDSGEVTLTLWNEDVDKVGNGDKVILKNGWCSEYQGELQVSAGKFGSMEVDKASGPAESETKFESNVEEETVE